MTAVRLNGKKWSFSDSPFNHPALSLNDCLSIRRNPMATAFSKNILFLQQATISPVLFHASQPIPHPSLKRPTNRPTTHMRAQARARIHCELRGETLDGKQEKGQKTAVS
ncbi:hypothetical protein [Sphingobium chlorophenolicum]|uniref:hypothetical protein n=1 Tax=Sphingobium chlorophenolicum TaxID=46429 RepID=UPI0012DE46B9|nr:hypothetical protein [Sphingobium chlorophenolicum]